jgi:hypothetical protein
MACCTKRNRNIESRTVKNRILHSGAVIALSLITWTALVGTANAQNDPKEERLSDELATLVRSRWETINIESGNSEQEWAGSYRSFDGPTVTTHLAWSPSSGFIVWWENCSRPWLARVNYGRVELTNGSLRIIPELSGDRSGSFPIAGEYIPVKWGEQRFLIPPDKMINFVHAANSNSIGQVESFLMKIADYGKERKGLPNVPPPYRKYLGRKPIIGAISGLGPKSKAWYPNVILNVGRAHGVVPEMRFYLSRPGKHFMVLNVTKVQKHTSEASVELASSRDNGEGIKPRVGWKVSSRAPKDSWQFMP